MIIGLDYDGTVTADRAFWMAFYYQARACGHTVYIVTMRHETEPVTDFPAMVYYTGRRAKKPWCESNGIKIDVWIDDNPEWLVCDSA